MARCLEKTREARRLWPQFEQARRARLPPPPLLAHRLSSRPFGSAGLSRLHVLLGTFSRNQEHVLGDLDVASGKRALVDKRLVLPAGRNGFEAVSITTQPTFAFGNPVAVPKLLRMGPTSSRTSYDITQDGRFVGLITAGQTEFVRGSEDQIQLVLNWLEDLKARVPHR